MELRIRRLAMEDLEELYRLLSDEAVMQYLEPPFDYEKTAAFLRQAGLTDHPLIFAVENSRHDFVGYVIYHPYGEDAYEAGWVLHRRYWGKGYASQLTEMLIQDAKNKAKNLVIECLPSQAAAKRIAEKYGFAYHGNQDGLDVYILAHS